MSEPTGDRLLGIAQAARIIGIHPGTLGSLVRQGFIQGERNENGHWVVRESALLRYAAALKAERELDQDA